MSALDVRVFKQLLEAQKARLLRDLEAARETAPSTVTDGDEPGYGNHMADEGTTTFQQEQNLALERHLLRTLQSVDEALQRIENGTYGYCVDCGQPISRERLEALPTATLCLADKEKREKRRH